MNEVEICSMIEFAIENGYISTELSIREFQQRFLIELKQDLKFDECPSLACMRALFLCLDAGLNPTNGLQLTNFYKYQNVIIVMATLRAFLACAYQSSRILSIKTSAVYSNEDYSVAAKGIIHIPKDNYSRGSLIGCYATARLAGGDYQFKFMKKSEIDHIKNTALTGYSYLWMIRYSEMAQKTVLRELLPYLPVTMEGLNLVAFDKSSDLGSQPLCNESKFLEFFMNYSKKYPSGE